MGDLPVVVAVRLSLSFPFLLSAVPLYAYDRSPYAPNTPQRCLFSDGGICSNFPIHFFDQPLPRWPTFGINLRSFHPEQEPGADQSQNVWMPRDNNDGRQPEWQPIDHLDRLGQLPAFARLILYTGLGWRDNVYLRAAGYFDRVAHIFLTDEEGGLNLAMSAPQIAALAERGRAAAWLLLERYTTPPAPAIDLTWDNHRWVRYRTLMEFIQLLLGRLAHTYRDTSHDERSYEDLVLRAAREEPDSYPLTRRDRGGAVYGADALIELYYRWRVDDVDLGVRAPNPGPEVRITPRT
jgi:predicted acylesterase/phospholipase RssA